MDDVMRLVITRNIDSLFLLENWSGVALIPQVKPLLFVSIHSRQVVKTLKEPVWNGVDINWRRYSITLGSLQALF
jgi:hypothetical protein